MELDRVLGGEIGAVAHIFHGSDFVLIENGFMGDHGLKNLIGDTALDVQRGLDALHILAGNGPVHGRRRAADDRLLLHLRFPELVSRRVAAGFNSVVMKRDDSGAVAPVRCEIMQRAHCGQRQRGKDDPNRDAPDHDAQETAAWEILFFCHLFSHSPIV